jgi:hypothetical protein
MFVFKNLKLQKLKNKTALLTHCHMGPHGGTRLMVFVELHNLEAVTLPSTCIRQVWLYGIIVSYLPTNNENSLVWVRNQTVKMLNIKKKHASLVYNFDFHIHGLDLQIFWKEKHSPYLCINRCIKPYSLWSLKVFQIYKVFSRRKTKLGPLHQIYTIEGTRHYSW